MESIFIARRFCGPPKSGNGGYVCGRVAGRMEGAVAVRLKAPPPLETELRLEHVDGGARLLHGESLVAEARPVQLDLVPPAAPSFAEAGEAAKSYSGFTRHLFPRCFVCGPQRGAGDGLRIFPGEVASRSLVAAPWVPDNSLADASGRVGREFLWAALDCTSAFALPRVAQGKAIVLGELHARIDGDVAPGEKCIAAGWSLEQDGRKRYGGSAVYSASGRPIAFARATWIEVPASAFGAL